jgi:hypothetical protein
MTSPNHELVHVWWEIGDILNGLRVIDQNHMLFEWPRVWAAIEKEVLPCL